MTTTAEGERRGGAAAWARAARRDLARDVFSEHASIRPVAAWILTLLLAVIVYLTIEYAPGAFERSKTGEGLDPGGVISVEAGYWTIALVALVALTVTFEPAIARRLGAGRISNWRERRRIVENSLQQRLIALAAVLLSIPSYIWSFVDFLFARPIAVAAGAAITRRRRRYLWGGGVVATSLGLGLFAPPAIGLAGVAAGICAIIGVVRRWSWLENDRNRFLIERGDREEMRRIGFEQDLRDEALISLMFLFALFPLLLQQVQALTCASGAEFCAFEFKGETDLPAGNIDQFVIWIGFFGAELAKSVPFVDWSEVFHVANASPIKPRTAEGAQLVFVMRATLDLLLLAAVLQAVEIAGRLHDQRVAFRAQRLPIIEPIAELSELKNVATGLEDALGIHPIEQPAIKNFERYDALRLKEIIAAEAGDLNVEVRKAAVALLARQYPSEQTDHFFNDAARTLQDAEIKRWIVHVAGGAEIARPPDARAADRGRLIDMVRDAQLNPQLRAAAARALGRGPLEAEAADALMEQMDRAYGASARVQAACGAALAKAGVGAARDPLRRLSERVAPEAVSPAMACAFALAQLDGPAARPDDVARLFAPPLRAHAARAARIARAPMPPADARRRERGAGLDQLVALRPDQDGLGDRFLMGSRDDPQAYDREEPQTEILIEAPFALGRFPVTQEEYLAFCDATGRKRLRNHAQPSWPATEVNWYDAVAYCRWLEEITGEPYRLPTEAEWEYACRAGARTRYHWGDDWDDANANTNQTGDGAPTPVDRHAPNAWGFWDMHGNVSEWCVDPWHDSHEGRPETSRAWIDGGDFSNRVLRGVSWFNNPQVLRSAFRNGYSRDIRGGLIGFRLAKTLRDEM